MANDTAKNTYDCLSLWPLDIPWLHITIWTVFLLLLSPITIIANATFIYALKKTQQLNTITNKFILIMNISDLGTGIFVLPTLAVMILIKDSFRSCTFELIVQYGAFFLAYFSFFMLMCVSMDRYIHITKLNRYNAFMNEFRMKIIVLVSFITSAIIAYISIAFPSFPLQVALNISDLAGVSFMFILYSLVFRKISLHAEMFKQRLGAASNAEKANREAKREMSATKTIRFVLGALIVFYFPYNICSAIWTYYKYEQRKNPGLTFDVLEYWAYIFVFSNAAINALLFGYGNSAIRNLVLNKFRKVSNQVEPSTLAQSTNRTAPSVANTVKGLENHGL